MSLNKVTQESLNKLGYNLTPDGDLGPKSKAAITDFVTELKTSFTKLNYSWPTKGFIGIRFDDVLTDTFDDIMVLVDNQDTFLFPCSTTLGHYYIFEKWMDPLGSAILKEGQYKQSHKFVTSANWKTLWLQMPYFQQVQPVKIYRDNKKDTNLDRLQEKEGLFGINIHRGWGGQKNWNVSAGCQVIPDLIWMEITKHFTLGETVDYTLIHKNSL